MSYIVCRNCKNYTQVDANAPLVFDKCENCGHTLEFAENDKALQFVLKDIELPKVAYHKICSNCNALNPRETATCMFCGNSSFLLQYDVESVNKYNDRLNDLKDDPSVVVINNPDNPRLSYDNKWYHKLFATVMGIVDFFMFFIIGIQLTIGELPDTANLMGVVTANMYPLISVVLLSLLFAGVLSVFILPKLDLRDAVTVSASVGLVIGFSTLLVNSFILVALTTLLFGFISALGGLISHVLLRSLVKRIIK
ncbi:MAG: hypothetical protein BZ136_02800 [Methanosphaera sp. rholeuAM74]|nr:MAG: hypothetical protein BZ136_02800 [Methanosphaera sp. rholeuAM74]